ncbi:ral guanine nucleotide dissociation stimulator-like [Dipodomys merriami]|uniref:ral guanine nucleotide dissociation stimulator-like n=1 Tax=Dipodomys merriami TaxID=94247 RepID=UPI003855CC20
MEPGGRPAGHAGDEPGPCLPERQSLLCWKLPHNYRLWGTMQQVLDIVFKKYRFPGRNSEEDEQVKNTLCSIFTMWMDCYPADFREPQNRHPVKELTHYAMLHMPSSDLVLHLHILLDELEETGKKETKKERKKSLCGHLRACE